MRFTSQGALDTSFGTLGFGEGLPLLDSHVAQALALTGAGDIVVAGIIEDFVDESGRSMFVARWCGN